MSTQRREYRPLASCMDRVGAPDRVSTNSLRSDRRNQQRVRLVVLFVRHGSPPLRQAAQAEAVSQASFRAFAQTRPCRLRARLHPALPRVPAAMNGRTERYDGKRDLHFQHAA